MTTSALITIAITCVSLLFTLVIVGVVVGVVVIPLVRSNRQDAAVAATGVEATATIVRTWDTGMRINNNPRVGMLLEVQPPSGPAFQAEVKHTVSIVQLAMFQPGVQLQVKYDPANPSHVAIVAVIPGGMMGGAAPGAPMAGSLMNAQQAEQLLMQYQTANDQLVKTGLPAAATVVQYTPLGVNVNGNNPAVSLIVEVHPTSRPAFTSQVPGVVIAEASVPKYQPGQMITVRYNPNDLTKVGLEHSGV